MMAWLLGRRPANPARALGLIGGAKRHAEAEARHEALRLLVLARARQLRAEKNLPPDPRLQPRHEKEAQPWHARTTTR